MLTLAGSDRGRLDAGDFLFAFCGRSLSIRHADGSLVYDSGDLIERAIARDAVHAPARNLFNTRDDENAFDDRSNNQGPGPEGVTAGTSLAVFTLSSTSNG